MKCLVQLTTVRVETCEAVTAVWEASTARIVILTLHNVDDDIAVGEDLEFQRKWWRFSSTMWRVFGVIVLADLFGCFGRGPLANANMLSSDKSVELRYERIERFRYHGLTIIHPRIDGLLDNIY